jgi:hypothetical protein
MTTMTKAELLAEREDLGDKLAVALGLLDVILVARFNDFERI